MRFKRLAAGLLAALLWASPVGAVSPDRWASCEIRADGLYAWDLPTDRAFSVTFTQHPHGSTFTTADGTWFLPGPRPSGAEAWITVRGGGPSLVKFGKQLNDYKVIAICEAP